MRTHTYILLLFALFHIGQSTAQSIQDKLKLGYDKFSASTAMQNGIASLCIQDSKTGTVLFEKNSSTGLPTASTLKVITSITAFDILGSDFTYKTKLGLAGTIDSLGVLQGDVLIIGSGDPTLGSIRFATTTKEILLNKWISSLKAQGIKSITGRIIADDRLYLGQDLPSGWIWGDMGNYYGAGISSLNWGENKIGIIFSPNTIGTATPIKNSTSDLSYLTVINQVTTGGKSTGDNVYAYSAPYSEKIYLKGTYGIDLNKTIEISLPDPALDLALTFHKYAIENGISIDQQPNTAQRLVEMDSIVPNLSKEVDIHTSPKLNEIIYWFNQKSINLYGEALLKSLAYVTAGKTNAVDGSMYLQKYWEQKLQITKEELKTKDGSGLSPQNNVSTRAMNKIMQYALKRPWTDDFKKSLPIYNQMMMKSGTIGGTLGYTGYHSAKDGKTYTFSFLVYNYSGTAANMRQQMFQVLDILK